MTYFLLRDCNILPKKELQDSTVKVGSIDIQSPKGESSAALLAKRGERIARTMKRSGARWAAYS